MSGRGPNDLTRVTFAVLTLALLMGASLWVLRPFLGPTIWAVMVVVATWPLMLRVQRWLCGRRSLAVAVMTLLLLLLFVVPLTLAIVTIVQQRRPPRRAGPSWPPATTCPRRPSWLPRPAHGGPRLERCLGAGGGRTGWRPAAQRLTPYAGNLTAGSWPRWAASACCCCSS
jgi:hypothetical protein